MALLERVAFVESGHYQRDHCNALLIHVVRLAIMASHPKLGIVYCKFINVHGD